MSLSNERIAVLEAANRIAGELRADGLTVEVDDREGIKPGAKYYHWEQRGVPIRLELGPATWKANASWPRCASPSPTNAAAPRRSPCPGKASASQSASA
ncbi:MAG: hypothetical protein GY930_14935 [bacterium]|nr:hypothetical protein [bacterium]